MKLRSTTLLFLAPIWVGFAPPESEVPPEPGVVVEPSLYAPETISIAGTNDLGVTFSPSGNRLAFVRWTGAIEANRQRLFLAERTEEGWSEPRAVPALEGFRVDWPMFTSDNELLLSWCGPYAGKPQGLRQSDDFDLWRLRLGGERSDDVVERLVGERLNLVKGDDVWNIGYVHNETGPQLAEDGTLYFWSERAGGVGRRDIFAAEPREGGGFGEPYALPSPINTARLEDEFLVDPGERWILFGTDRGGRSRDTDLVLAERGSDGTWGAPVALPEGVNTPWIETGPALVDNGATLVFASNRPVPGRKARDWNLWSVPVSELGSRTANVLSGTQDAGQPD